MVNKLGLGAFGLVLLAGSASAQSIDSLPEAQQVAYCAGYFLAKDSHEGTETALTQAYIATAAEVSGQTVDDLRPKLEKTTPMLVPFFETYDSNDSAKQMLDQSQSYCGELAKKYVLTQAAIGG